MVKLPDDLKIRNSKPSDHPRIINVLRDWWDGRDLAWMLPKFFLMHFCDTSFIIEKDDELIAFLVGFLSQSRANEGYIHFAGVHPKYRGIRLGAYIYNQFFEICIQNNRNIIGACTSPVNKGSIGFHTKMGFQIKKGNAEINGVQVTLDYNRHDDPKVLFEKYL